jgi:hypothetical protein
MRNSDVTRAWARGDYAKAANLWTDGDSLFSYNLKIGYRNDRGETIAIPYRSGTRYGFRSVTTSRHVGLALQYCDCVQG